MNPILVPAAQYLRMSTEHQRYSMQNQSEAIHRYAEEHGFTITQTYSDAAKSGVILKNRKGLRQLLQDVVSGTDFKAILVYDVSRWGRFQDTHESAHYEFLCKSAGIPVHYCAETFASDGTLSSLIMKALKRTMAGEYSRELGVKIVAGQKRLVELGFKQGGMPGYGLRRFLISADRTPKQPLRLGERKSLVSDRVILVPGPPHEVECVREIYRMLIDEKKTVYAIARELNRRGIAPVGNSEWDYQAVHSILTHPKYAGCSVIGRTSQRLYTRKVQVPRSQWIVTPDAFEPLVDSRTFAEAQTILRSRTIEKSNDELLDALRAVYLKEGQISYEIISRSPDLPSPSAIRHRFGSLTSAYQMIGYQDKWGAERIERCRRLRALRADLLQQIVDSSPNVVSIESRGGAWRTRLHLRSGRLIPVLVCPCFRVWKDSVRWLFMATIRDRPVVLIARATPANNAFKDFFILPNKECSQKRLAENDPRLQRGVRFTDPAHFCSAVEQVRAVKSW